ncbi:MAG: DNA-binding protein [Clostridia bacterium]|nr:DNA-binding protein [Clostridia bacterium]
MKTHALRLHRGDDLRQAIEAYVQAQHIKAGCILCGVGCVSRIRLRDASGVTIRELDAHGEIVSITGTVSENRCHIHVSFALEDLSVIGGHLCEGCIINTTCELVIEALDGIAFSAEYDPETGYDELKIEQIASDKEELT